MSAEYRSAVQLFQEFKPLFEQKNPQLEKCKELMSKLKLETAKLSYPSSPLSPEQEKQHAVLIREILEYGALLSVLLKDIPSFERYISQLKTYYFDSAHKLPPSSRQYMIIGLNLLHLLAKNKLDEFHTELELIPLEQFQDVYIKHPVQLEQYMMEGTYNKVVKAKDLVPTPYYAYFMDLLMGTVRNEIADCIEKAYTNLTVADAQKLLDFSNADQMRNYAKERSWAFTKTNQGEVLSFASKQDEDSKDIPSMKLIKQQLQYARELERII